MEDKQNTVTLSQKDFELVTNILKEISSECNKVTSGNVSHKINNLRHMALGALECLKSYNYV